MVYHNSELLDFLQHKKGILQLHKAHPYEREFLLEKLKKEYPQLHIWTSFDETKDYYFHEVYKCVECWVRYDFKPQHCPACYHWEFSKIKNFNNDNIINISFYPVVEILKIKIDPLCKYINTFNNLSNEDS